MKIKLLDPNAKIPTLGSKYAAGYDLYASKACVIENGQTVLVHTGIAMEIPIGYWGGIYARSGLATKQGLRPANCVGVIDADYRGEVGVILINLSGEAQTIEPGERICQMVIAKHETPEVVEVSALSETERGAGGFGHSGRN